MKILVTGATGFLGSRAMAFLSHSCEVQAVPSALLRGELTPARLDQLRAFLSEAEPNVLLHTAAISDTGYAENHSEESRLANVELPAALARLTAELGCKLVSCSSDQVYGGCAERGPFAEDEPLTPANVYGRHKLEAERRVAEINPDAVSLRLTWMYDLPVYGMPTHANLLMNLLSAAARGTALELYDTDFRGITYVRQAVTNLPKAFELPGGVYNFGSESDVSTYKIAAAWGRALRLNDGLVRPLHGTPRSLCMDCAKIRKASIVFDDSAAGIRRCISDYNITNL